MTRLLAGAGVAALMMSAPAYAQAVSTRSDDGQAPPAADAQAAAPDSGLKDIIVTAQRRSENLQRAAVAVDVVTGAALTNSAITSPTQLGTLVPALAVQSAGGANTTFFVRGVGNFSVNGYTDPAVAFNYDGVYVGRPTSTSGVIYDLERVEVLKGPQGTLYGRNATAGAINIIPARPQPGVVSGYLSGSYGNYDAVNLQGAVNLPLGADGAIRVSGNLTDHDGYLSDGTSDEKTQALRVQMLGELTPDLTVRMAADYSHTGGIGGGSNYATRFAYNPALGQYVTTDPGLDRSVGVLDPAAQAFRRASFAGLPGRTLGQLDPGVYQDNSYYGANGEIAWKTDAGTLTIVPAFRSARLNNRFDVPGFAGYIQENDAQYSVEARFAGRRIGIFDYIVGGYFFDETVKGNYTFDQDALAAYQDFTSHTKSYAAFGRLTANVTDRLRFVGGLRYTKDDKRFDGTANVVLVVCTVRVAGVPSCPAAPVLPVTDMPAQLPFANVPGGTVPIGTTGALAVSSLVNVAQPLTNDRVTYRGAVEYDLAAHSLLYASYETGYRSGGFALAIGHETFQPEYITAYTIGLKNRLFDNRLQFNLEAFLWDYRNQQVNHTGVDLAGNTTQFVDNVGKSINKGVEADAQLLVTRTTLLSANVQYLDARFKEFVYRQPLGSAPPYTSCAVSIDPANAALYKVDCSGKQAYQSPKWTINLSAQQTVPVGRYKVVVEGDTQYKSSRYIGFDYVPFEHVGDTWTSNAQVGFGPADDRWTLTAFVRNIENDRIPVYAAAYSLGGLGIQTTTPPRTYGLRASVTF